MHIHLTKLIGHIDLVQIGKGATVPFMPFLVQHRQVIDTQNHVLGWRNDRFPVSRFEQVLRSEHQFARFLHCFLSQGHVNSHLVTVEVRVEGRTHQRVQLDS